MDLVVEMLLVHLRQHHSQTIAATSICAPFHRRFTRLGHSRPLVTADRFVNRWRDYPRFVSALNGSADLYHIVDHSYSHLAHYLSSRRVIVTCHDLDAFRCLIAPDEEPRSKLFRKVSEYVLTGLQKATRVVCDSRSTRDGLLYQGLVPPERVTVVPLGVHPAFLPHADLDADAEAVRLLGPSRAAPEILHVGSTIPRKRIDILLQIFAELRRTYRDARLVRIGGHFTRPQMAWMDRLGLNGSVSVLPFLEPRVLAAVYRRASLVILPSEREGFGFPVVESMACGTAVVASDLPALKEVGGEAAVYCSVGLVEQWTRTIIALIREQATEPERAMKRVRDGIQQAAKFTWYEHARRMVDIYRQAVLS